MNTMINYAHTYISMENGNVHWFVGYQEQVAA